jgi:dipeptidyl aminopeptidase/acylaminoacyl peptidase
MRESLVEFYSEGCMVRGLWRTPDAGFDAPYPALIQGPGWLGLKDANLYVRYHEAFTDSGFAVLVIDYRGFGDSEGDRDVILPDRQVEDLVNGVTYLTTRDDVDPSRIGVFGSGGTGGGNAVLLAAQDPRVRCVVVQVPVADGEDWLRGMRREDEWRAFLARIDADRVRRVVTGTGDSVHPREEITVSTPERRATKVKADVDHRVPDSVSLRSAEAIMAYKPIDVVDRIAPRSLMIVAVEDDTVTPTDHATGLYQRAGPPKRLVMQRNTTHYAAYDRYRETVTPMMVDWLSRGLVGGGPVATPRQTEGIDVVEALSESSKGES